MYLLVTLILKLVPLGDQVRSLEKFELFSGYLSARGLLFQLSAYLVGLREHDLHLKPEKKDI